jgi:uncharacterized protein YggE
VRVLGAPTGMKVRLTGPRVASLALTTLAAGFAGALLTSATAATVSASGKDAGSGAGIGCGANEPAVTVDGTATVQGTPDEMTISLGAHTSAPSAEAAMAASAAKAQALVNVLLAAGVAKSGIQTSNLSVQPNYNAKGEITGYEVDNDFTVTLQGAAELQQAGNVIDAAGKAAGNALRIDGISFSLSNASTLMAEARAGAVRDARSQAAAMAAAAGEGLGPLCSLQDESQVSPPPPVEPFVALPPSATTTPVEAGSLQVTATVMAVYALVPPAA